VIFKWIALPVYSLVKTHSWGNSAVEAAPIPPGNSRPAQPCLKSGEASPEAERRVAACEFSPAIKGRSACLVPRAPARGSICSSYSVN